MASMERSAIWGILILALAIRLVVAFGVQSKLDNVWKRPFVISGDAEGYWELANRIANGETYSVHTPPRYVMRMPGYPLFLSGVIQSFGENRFAARIATVIVGSLTVGLVFLLGKTLFTPRVGLVGALLSAVSPLAIGSSVLLLRRNAVCVFLDVQFVVFCLLATKYQQGFTASIACHGGTHRADGGAGHICSSYVAAGHDRDRTVLALARKRIGENHSPVGDRRNLSALFAAVGDQKSQRHREVGLDDSVDGTVSLRRIESRCRWKQRHGVFRSRKRDVETGLV